MKPGGPGGRKGPRRPPQGGGRSNFGPPRGPSGPRYGRPPQGGDARPPRAEGARPPRADGARPPRRDFAPRIGDSRPPRPPRVDGAYPPRRDDARPPRRDFAPRSGDSRPPRPPRADGAYPPRRDFAPRSGDARPPQRDDARPPRRDFAPRSDDARPPRRDDARPPRPYDARPPRRDFAPRSDDSRPPRRDDARPPRPYDARPPRRDFAPRGDDSRPPRRDDARPPRPYDARPPRRDFAPRSDDSRPPRRDDARPPRADDARPPRRDSTPRSDDSRPPRPEREREGRGTPKRHPQKTLERVLSKAGLGSRTQARSWIHEGRVAVNGKVTENPDLWIDFQTDKVTLDGQPLEAERKRYLLLYKPKGFVTTFKDPDGRPTVYDLMKDVKTWIAPVGRLDLDTTGLLILTNDTQLAERLTNPDHKVPKTYQLKCSTIVPDEQLELLRNGLELADGPTRPAIVKRLRDSEKYSHLEITITEGRNRQVRRMIEALGSKVLKLTRIAIGSVRIEDLEIGTYRELTPAELEALTEQHA